ncbi:matrix-remodeling-associated protein 7 isoform X2 [Opisthocomus hoazin]|uniref:matrix-remodeling-associated protein 7 isoform X2 n=1 Tax=Opisthocomus hoazin TaxID=30419 RepID=UPI003F531371
MAAVAGLSLAVPLLCTVLAIVLAALFVRLRGGGGGRPAERPREPEPGAEGGREPAGGVGEEAAAEPSPAAPSPPQQPPAEPPEPGQREEAEESELLPPGPSPASSLEHTGEVEDGCGPTALSSKAEEEDPDLENEELVVREPEDEDAADEAFSFKYSPGKLRGDQYKSMMTKEELEEEQRTEDDMKLSLASS